MIKSLYERKKYKNETLNIMGSHLYAFPKIIGGSGAPLYTYPQKRKIPIGEKRFGFKIINNRMFFDYSENMSLDKLCYGYTDTESIYNKGIRNSNNMKDLLSLSYSNLKGEDNEFIRIERRS